MTEASRTTFLDVREAEFQVLKVLFARRREIHRMQEFVASWQMVLLRLEVPESNVQSLDLRDGGKLVGVWLKKRDYAGKLRRKEQAQQALQKVHEAERQDGEFPGLCTRPPWGPEKVKPTGKAWERSDYVVIDPPLYPPAEWLARIKGG